MNICLICNLEFSIKQEFLKHIRKTHNMTQKDYYDIYLKKHNEGICSMCGKETPFRGIEKGYQEHCSQKCANNNPRILATKKNTCLEHFGTTSYLSTDNARECCKKALQSNVVKEKRNKTMIERYGCAATMHSSVIREKIAKTNRERYGTDYPFQSTIIKDKIAQTLQIKYGVSNPYCIPEIHKKANNLDSREKMRQTCLSHFGVESPLQSREVRLKGVQTMRANGQYSSLENYLEHAFIENNIKYKHIYNKDSRYPYHCDFYLPDSDAFVEINGWWHHGKHWYDETSDKDAQTLQKWMCKSTNNPQYKAAINTWTIYDVEKRNTAKQNNINYIVLWSKKDIINWINSGFEIRKDY